MEQKTCSCNGNNERCMDCGGSGYINVTDVYEPLRHFGTVVSSGQNKSSPFTSAKNSKKVGEQMRDTGISIYNLKLVRNEISRKEKANILQQFDSLLKEVNMFSKSDLRIPFRYIDKKTSFLHLTNLNAKTHSQLRLELLGAFKWNSTTATKSNLKPLNKKAPQTIKQMFDEKKESKKKKVNQSFLPDFTSGFNMIANARIKMESSNQNKQFINPLDQLKNIVSGSTTDVKPTSRAEILKTSVDAITKKEYQICSQCGAKLRTKNVQKHKKKCISRFKGEHKKEKLSKRGNAAREIANTISGVLDVNQKKQSSINRKLDGARDHYRLREHNGRIMSHSSYDDMGDESFS